MQSHGVYKLFGRRVSSSRFVLLSMIVEDEFIEDYASIFIGSNDDGEDALGLQIEENHAITTVAPRGRAGASAVTIWTDEGDLSLIFQWQFSFNFLYIFLDYKKKMYEIQ